MNPLRNQKGIALLTVLLVLVIMTVIGIAAITVTGFENRIAGFSRTAESATTAAESCLGTAVNIIQHTIDQGSLPAAFLDNATPVGPVPQGNAVILNQEILGQSNNNADEATVAPNTLAVIGGFTVRGDIDRLYAKPKSGGSLQFASGYEGTAGGAAGGGIDILYRVNCVSMNAGTNTTSRITAVYACTATGESCQRQI
jgi:Tfp pilus assembly protein PilX